MQRNKAMLLGLCIKGELSYHALHLRRELPPALLLELRENAALVVVVCTLVEQQSSGQLFPATKAQYS